MQVVIKALLLYEPHSCTFKLTTPFPLLLTLISLRHVFTFHEFHLLRRITHNIHIFFSKAFLNTNRELSRVAFGNHGLFDTF